VKNFSAVPAAAALPVSFVIILMTLGVLLSLVQEPRQPLAQTGEHA